MGHEHHRQKKAIPHQYLEKAGFAPSPDSSKLAVILYSAMVLKNRYHEPHELKFTLPPQLTYADLGTRAAERILFRNPLDPINHVQWLVNDLLARRAANQPWQPINLMQTNATGMAFIPREHLTEISLGPYTVNLMYGYITSIQVNEVMSQQQYGSLDQYNAACKQPPRFVQAYYFDQVAPPVNWNANEYGLFQPCRISIFGDKETIGNLYQTVQKATFLQHAGFHKIV